MIFQIDYKSNNKYDIYFNYNSTFELNDYIIFNDEKINSFLLQFNYYDIFNSFKVDQSSSFAENAILCDALRLMILYEFGGVYIDADVYFKKEIINIENHFQEKFNDRTIILSNRSFYFLRAKKKSKYIKKILDYYIQSKVLKLDIFMLRNIEILKYHKELMIIPEKYLKPFFEHHKITTGLK